MATFLYRLGRQSFRRRRIVAAVWMTVLALVAVGAIAAGGTTSASFTIPGTEAQQGIDLLAERFPQMGANGASARVVIEAPAGQTLADDADRQAVEHLVARLGTVPQVALVMDPFQGGTINQSGTIAYIPITFAASSLDITSETHAAMAAAVESARADGLTVETGGTGLAAPVDQGLNDAVGVIVALVVLVVTLGSVVAGGLPLATAVIGIGLALATIGLIGAVIPLSSTTPVLALMLGLAVSLDYALLIVARYRHEVASGRPGEEAAAVAVATAGSAVAVAGATVIIALAGMAVVGIPILTELGLAAAGAVAIAVLIALTLLPAFLGFLGRNLERGTLPGLRSRDPEAYTRGGAFERWATLVTSHAVPTLVLAAGLLVVVALPALSMRLGLPDDGMASPDSSEHRAYALVSEGFGPGANGPLAIVVDTSGSTSAADRAAAAATAIAGLPNVAAVTPATVDATGRTAVFQVIPRTGPSDAATEALVHEIRHTAAGLSGLDGALLFVTGQTALNLDMSARMADALPLYLALVVGLAYVLLAVVFRSLLIPLKAMAGFLLTIAATFGVLVAVFQWGWFGAIVGVAQTGPIISLLPIVLVGIVFGLAMDYEIFLVSRIREEHMRGAAPRAAIVTGFGHGAAVVAAAALIMISVFAGFATSSDVIIKGFALALATAVLVDAFVVRMTIVPAAMALLDRHAWWLPRWLDRAIPRIDVEGRGLPAVGGPARLEPEPVIAD